MATIKHRFQSAVANSINDKVSSDRWNDSLVVAGGTDTGVLFRDSGATDGWSVATTLLWTGSALKFPDGTAAIPCIAPSSDPDTGLCWITTDPVSSNALGTTNLALSVDGSIRAMLGYLSSGSANDMTLRLMTEGSAVGAHPRVDFIRSRASGAVPQSGDSLGLVAWGGRRTATSLNTETATLNAVAEATFSATDSGTGLHVLVTAPGGTTRGRALYIAGGANILLGDASAQTTVPTVPSARLVVMNNSTGTQPIQEWQKSDATVQARLSAAGLFTCIAGTTLSPVVVKRHTNTTAQANTTTSADEVLRTVSLDANTLDANGRGVRITAWGSCAGTGSKTHKMKFGATQIATSPAHSTSSAWRIDATVLRTGASAQEAIGSSLRSSGNEVITQSTPAEDTTAAIAIDVIANAANVGEVTFEGLVVEVL